MATSGEEFDEYASALTELVLNSKPIINSLTILAGEIAGKDEGRARAVATLIRAHIRGLPPKSKLCGFYLLDSVVKNLRGPFVRCFSTGLSDLFLPAYAKVDESQKKSMFRLFNTWKTVFPSSALDDIEPYLAPRAAPQPGRVAPHVTAPQPQWPNCNRTATATNTNLESATAPQLQSCHRNRTASTELATATAPQPHFL